MNIPRQPNPGDAAHQALLDRAFAAHSGAAPGQADNEQREDELLSTVDSSLDHAKEAVAELKRIQEEEENAPVDHEMAEQNRTKPMPSEDTGSPSAQGFP